MRETHFIRQNKDKWGKFEEVLKSKESDPDELNDLFIQVTDDLSYARTFYPNRSVRVYLNGLAQRIFIHVYKNKRESWSKIKGFWTHELPSVAWHSRKDMLLSLVVFLFCVVVGAFSTHMDPDFPRTILGGDYVDMTIKNIKAGDPMAVYKGEDPVTMFLGITLNNLRVSLLAFALGCFFGIGTLSVLMYNGVMVGAFQYFFYQQQQLLEADGLFWESFLTIWIHGTIEISSIVLAGAAGLALGRALVFPGTYSRLNSFLIASRRALKLLLGIAPLIVLAGFFEGFLTRFTETPNIIRAAFILVSFLFMVFYFVVFPARRNRAGLVPPLKAPKLAPDDFERPDFEKVKSNGELFQEVIPFVKRFAGRIFGACLIASVLIAFAVSQLFYDQLYTDTVSLDFESIRNELILLMFEFVRFFRFGKVAGLYFWQLTAWTILSSGVLYSLISLVDPSRIQAPKFTGRLIRFFTRIFFPSLLAHAVFLGIFFLDLEGFAFLMLFAYPVFLFWSVSMAMGKNPLSAAGETTKLVSGGAVQMVGLIGLFLLLSLVIFMFLNAPLLWFYLEFLNSLIKMDGKTSAWYFRFVKIFFNSIALFFSASLAIAGMGYAYFSVREKVTAQKLLEKIALIGNKEEKR